MPKEEIQHYEALLEIIPENEQVLLQLGILYFKNGQIAQALQLYEKLQHINPEKGEKLISYYGASLSDVFPF